MSANLPPALDIATILGSPPPKLDFVLPGLVAGHVGAIVAPGSTGKSFLELQIGVGIAASMPIAEGAFPKPAEPRRVVILAGEDDRNNIAVRLHAIVDRLTDHGVGTRSLFPPVDRERLAANLRANLQIHALHGQAPRLVADPDTVSLADELCEYAKGARLLVVDPLRRFHSGDENDSAIMTRLVQAIERVAAATGVAVLLAHHTNKASALNGMGDQQQAVRGSSALTDAIRWQLNMVKMSEAEATDLRVDVAERGLFVRLETAKANYLAPQPPVWLRRLAGGVLKQVPLGASKAAIRGVGHAR